MRDPRQEDLVEVAEHVRERLRPLRRLGWQPRPDLPRLDLREHRMLANAVEVARRPVERGLPVLPKPHSQPSQIGIAGGSTITSSWTRSRRSPGSSSTSGATAPPSRDVT